MQIKISKIAFGSLSTSIGDSTLGYSPEVTFRGRDVDGLYVDNPQVLSNNYSSLIWRYYADTDNYMLTHVQAMHVVDKSMGRMFPYRGAYEVSREEMNRTGFSVASVMDVMPRIEQFPKQKKWNLEENLLTHVRKGDKDTALRLAEHIKICVASRKRIFISIKTEGRNLRENGVFATDEFNTLIEAIDMINLGLRRYASFAFCVDEHYAKALDEVLITVYARESSFKLPEGANAFKWEEISSLNIPSSVIRQLDDYTMIMNVLPGQNEKLLPLDAMMQKVKENKNRLDAVRTMRHADFTPNDYAIWKQLGHTDNELRADNWTELDKIVTMLGNDMDAKRTVVRNYKGEISGCKDAASYISLVSRYKGLYDDATLVGIMRDKIDPIKNKSIVEELINSRKQLSRSVGTVITNALQEIAGGKAEALGTDIDQWMRFLGKLENDDDEPLTNSRVFYLTQILKWQEKKKKEFANNMVRFKDAHPKRAKNKIFELIVKTLNSILERKKLITNEPKSPSNNQQENKNRTIMVAEDSNNYNEFDELYEEIVKEEKKETKKKQITFSVLAFVLGAVLTCGAVFAYNRLFPEKSVTGGVSSLASNSNDDKAVAISIKNPSQNLMLQMSTMQDNLGALTVVLGDSVYEGIADIGKLNEVNNTYIKLQNDSSSVAVVAFVNELDSMGAKIGNDELTIDAGTSLLSKLSEKSYRVDRVQVADTISIDIPNGAVFNKLHPDKTNYGTQTLAYYFWLINWIDNSLNDKGYDVKIDY